MQYADLKSIVARVSYPGYHFGVAQSVDVRFTGHIWVEYEEPDVDSGVLETQKGRPWAIPVKWNSGQVVRTCLKAILTSLEHRCREHFLFDGYAIANPHFDNLEAMKEFCKKVKS